MKSTWREWRHLSSPDIAHLAPEAVAVLPLAAIEQHGPHLPVSVDEDLIHGVMQRAAQAWDGPQIVLQLPTMSVGFSPEHLGFAGTLSLSSSTLIRLWTEVAESVHASGVRKLLLFNSHGGQTAAMDLVARDLRQRLGMLVVSSSWFQLPMDDALAEVSAHEQRFGVHAGQVETAMMLALARPGVNMAHAARFASSSEARAKALPVLGNGHSAKLAWMTRDLNPAGAVGDAASATPELGERLLAASACGLVQLLRDLHATNPVTTRPDEVPKRAAGPGESGL